MGGACSREIEGGVGERAIGRSGDFETGWIVGNREFGMSFGRLLDGLEGEPGGMTEGADTVGWVVRLFSRALLRGDIAGGRPA